MDILDIWSEVLKSGRDLARVAVEYERRVNPVWPLPDLARLLDDLRGQQLVLGIVSKAQLYTPLMLEGFLGLPLADLGLDAECCVWS